MKHGLKILLIACAVLFGGSMSAEAFLGEGFGFSEPFAAGVTIKKSHHGHHGRSIHRKSRRHGVKIGHSLRRHRHGVHRHHVRRHGGRHHRK